MKNKIVDIISVLVLLGAGIVMLVNPNASANVAVTILGIALIAFGLFSALKFLLAKENKRTLDIVFGIAALIFGIVVLVASNAVVTAFPILTGVVIAAAGGKDLIAGIKSKDTLGIIFAIVTIVLGILVFVNPFKATEILVRVVGVVLIYLGVTGFITTVKAKA